VPWQRAVVWLGCVQHEIISNLAKNLLRDSGIIALRSHSQGTQRGSGLDGPIEGGYALCLLLSAPMHCSKIYLVALQLSTLSVY